MRPNTLDDFWDFVDLHGPLPMNKPELGECWMWIGSFRKLGYGRFFMSGKAIASHRLAYELIKGHLP